MSNENPFETRFEEYDAWFERFPNVFESELRAVRAVLPDGQEIPERSVEIGVGSGRFAQALGIPMGIEPAEGISTLARERGIQVLRGVAEALPLPPTSFDAAFLLTSLCFIEDARTAFQEVARILTFRGWCVIAFLPADSPFGELYCSESTQDPFFRHAILRPRTDVIAEISEAGLRVARAVHTLTTSPACANEQVENPRPGWTEGAFVVLRIQRAARRSDGGL